MNNEQTKTNVQWQVLHIKLQDLLAAYADDMLDDQDKALVEAHLSGCEACRMDVSRQQLLSRRLNNLPVSRMSTELHQRLDQALGKASLCKEAGNNKETSLYKNDQRWFSFNWLRKLKVSSFATASGWSVAMILLVVMLLPHSIKQGNGNTIPMVRDVLAEYQQFSKTTLPVSVQGLAEAPPATWSGSHVLASWKTTIGGAPADVFAVRNGDSVVFQFKVDEAVFFNNPEVRNAVSKMGDFSVREKGIAVLAMPIKSAGLLMVGPVGAIPMASDLTI
jgi:hypothetical protein